ncbi:class II aldolase/adducin family protein [Komagataeibacter sp. AV436]|uniref:Class II aldolase/adducin family protein n=1 Tax=Komagataeibacter melomenusus TaxID=2766578 RepID=A0ABX2ACQ8_9PROT|nr:class II aldolase/adducin family protein [Komagataeibacter melomenusus]MBV1831822.1 class II aldolase/adducin family protein [Komagataeibacter melomenusus]NPC66131.1 class II aldolase/adducin family protein [Komagataeibacter melomenusus]
MFSGGLSVTLPSESFSASEWKARCELAALYRLIAYFRMTDLIDTHISMAIPDDPGHFLINRYGKVFNQMRASDLVRIDKFGHVKDLQLEQSNVNAAGFVIHSAIHQARPDLKCIIHTHTPNGAGVSAQEDGLLPISQHALKFYGCLSYHAYEGIALRAEEKERLIADLGTNNAMILRNHGLLVGGRHVAHAFHEIYFLERACQIQIHALAGGRQLSYPPEDVRRRTAEQFQRDEAEEIIQRAWTAALSLIEDEKESYCS